MLSSQFTLTKEAFWRVARRRLSLKPTICVDYVIISDIFNPIFIQQKQISKQRTEDAKTVGKDKDSIKKRKNWYTVGA